MFNPKPKTRREELYDREEELPLIENSIERAFHSLYSLESGVSARAPS